MNHSSLPYYVYFHINPDGNVFYIGSNHYAGDPNRAYNEIQRTDLWKQHRKDGYKVEIVKRFDNREDCVKYEHKKIHEYHDIGQCLACKEDRRGKRNGRYGSTWKEEEHPMFGTKGGFFEKSHDESTKLQIRTSNPNRISIVQMDLNGKEIKRFLSLRQVEEETGFNRKTVSKRIKDGKPFKGYLWRNYLL